MPRAIRIHDVRLFITEPGTDREIEIGPGDSIVFPEFIYVLDPPIDEAAPYTAEEIETQIAAVDPFVFAEPLTNPKQN